jgi:cobalamin biosynthesis protein CbiG
LKNKIIIIIIIIIYQNINNFNKIYKFSITNRDYILTKAIKLVAHKNIKQIKEWQKLNPYFNDPESKQNDDYMKILLSSMSGSTKEECNNNYEKIVKNVVKETVIEK